MKYFRAEEDPEQTRIPKTFVEGFLEVSFFYGWEGGERRFADFV